MADRTSSRAEVTVVVITRDRVRRLLQTLERLHATGASLIVVDNGSTDGTAEQVRAGYPETVVVRFRRNRGAAARTAAVRLASTPYVAFSDDDSWWEEGALQRGVEALRASPQLGLVAARVLVGPQRRLDPASARMARSPLAGDGSLPGPRVLGFVACAVICRRDAYLATGGFHPRYGVGGEEALVALDLARRGYACAYVADVVAHHHPERAGGDPADHRRRRRVAARNDLWTAWLRLPARHALERTAAIVRQPGGAHGLARALGGVPWVARERDPVRPELADELQAVVEHG